MRKHQIIEVEWLDSGGQTDIWEWSDEYTYDRHILRTVGYYLGRHDGYLYLCQSLNPDQVGRKFRIPKGCIQSVKKLGI